MCSHQCYSWAALNKPIIVVFVKLEPHLRMEIAKFVQRSCWKNQTYSLISNKNNYIFKVQQTIFSGIYGCCDSNTYDHAEQRKLACTMQYM